MLVVVVFVVMARYRCRGWGSAAVLCSAGVGVGVGLVVGFVSDVGGAAAAVDRCMFQWQRLNAVAPLEASL